MADREIIAATLAAGALGPITYQNVGDMKTAVARVASHAVDVYHAILAELAKRQASGGHPISN